MVKSLLAEWHAANLAALTTTTNGMGRIRQHAPEVVRVLTRAGDALMQYQSVTSFVHVRYLMV
jgi:hypothetical protein